MTTRIVSALVLICAAWGAEKRQLTEAETRAAYDVSVQRIREMLKAPSTAQFAPYAETRFSPSILHSIKVEMWVDAQNSYGAMLRNAWWCKVHPQQRPDGLYRVSCLEGLGLIPKDRVVGFTGAK